MLFVFNIGNTHTQYTIFDGKHPQTIQRCPTASFSGKLFPNGMSVAGASVAPSATAELSTYNIFWVNSSIKSIIDFSLIEHSTVGADRLANLFRLEEISCLPAVCFDFGTAITMEIIDAERHFHGGAIAPGRMLLRRALNDHTAQLPLIELFSTPPEAFGRNTRDSIRLGVDSGAISVVRGLIERARSEFTGQKIIFYGIGGDAPFFTNAIPELKVGGTDFTLQGIRRAWELNHES